MRQENLDLRKELKESKELSVQVSNAFLNALKEKHEIEMEEQRSTVSDLRQEIIDLRRDLKEAKYPRVNLNKKS